MISSCAVIIRKPYAREEVTLGIRAAWAMHSAGGVDVTVILMGDGVFGILGKVGYVPGLFGQFMEQEGPVYAVREDMAARSVDEARLPPGVTALPASGVAALVAEVDAIMTF